MDALFGEGIGRAAGDVGRAALETGKGVYEGGKAVVGKAVESFAGAPAPAPATFGDADTYGRPATTGQGKKAQTEAETAAAHQTAEARRPEAQRDNTPVTTPTNSGAAGPRDAGVPGEDLGPFDRVVSLPGEAGFAIVHAGPDGVGPPAPDPATQPGGFAHPGAERADPTGRFAEEKRIAALPEHGTTEYGPRGATGGHSWTRRTPGRQEATYDDARYRREVQARQAAEDAAIGELDARAASALAEVSRSRELEQDPFAPEKAEVAAAVGEQMAKARPEREAMELAMGLADQMQERIAEINAMTDISEEERAQRVQEAKEMFWSYMAGIRPRARKPKPEYGVLGPESEEV
jgi:hypothetical protein